MSQYVYTCLHVCVSVHLGAPAVAGLALGRSNMPQGFGPFGNMKRSEMPQE